MQYSTKYVQNTVSDMAVS